MFFSKSFGYAIRAIHYLALHCPGKKWVQLNEIADYLKIPQAFLGKLMINLVREGVVDSRKGPSGGFCVNEKTLNHTLIRLLAITGEKIGLDSCVLRMRDCDSANPCPLHFLTGRLRDEWVLFLSSTTMEDMMKSGNEQVMHTLTNPGQSPNG